MNIHRSKKAWLFAFIDLAFILLIIYMLKPQGSGIYDTRFANKLISVTGGVPSSPTSNEVIVYIDDGNKYVLEHKGMLDDRTSIGAIIMKMKELQAASPKGFSVTIAPSKNSSAQAYLLLISLIASEFHMNPKTRLIANASEQK